MDENKVGSSYHANSPEAQRRTYDDWASQTVMSVRINHHFHAGSLDQLVL